MLTRVEVTYHPGIQDTTRPYSIVARRIIPELGRQYCGPDSQCLDSPDLVRRRCIRSATTYSKQLHGKHIWRRIRSGQNVACQLPSCDANDGRRISLQDINSDEYPMQQESAIARALSDSAARSASVTDSHIAFQITFSFLPLFTSCS